MRKAQAAVEYLFTYGWAIMAAGIAIAALSAFFLSSPTTVVSERCQFTQDFNCVETTLQKVGNQWDFSFRVENIQGQLIDIQNITCEMDGNVYGATGVPDTLDSAQTKEYRCLNMDRPDNSEIANIELDITYIPDGLQFETTREANVVVRPISN